MKSLEHKTSLIFDLFFCVIIMPLLIILGPAKSGSTAVDASAAIATLTESLEDMEIGELFLLAMETLLISLTMSIL